MIVIPFALSLLALGGSSLAHNIQLRAHSRECFHEQLHKDDKMTVSFQVGDREFGGSGNMEVEFWVRYAMSNQACPDKERLPTHRVIDTFTSERRRQGITHLTRIWMANTPTAS